MEHGSTQHGTWKTGHGEGAHKRCSNEGWTAHGIRKRVVVALGKENWCCQLATGYFSSLGHNHHPRPLESSFQGLPLGESRWRSGGKGLPTFPRDRFPCSLRCANASGRGKNGRNGWHRWTEQVIKRIGSSRLSP